MSYSGGIKTPTRVANSLARQDLRRIKTRIVIFNNHHRRFGVQIQGHLYRAASVCFATLFSSSLHERGNKVTSTYGANARSPLKFKVTGKATSSDDNTNWFADLFALNDTTFLVQ